MTGRFLSNCFNGTLTMLGVVIIVFVLFQGFGDPARLIIGQRADAGTLNNIRKELNLDQPKWKQFIYYLNDVSPISIYDETELTEKNIRWVGFGGRTKLVLKFPYLRRSYQTRKQVWPMIMEALPSTIFLAFFGDVYRDYCRYVPGYSGSCKKRHLAGYDRYIYQCARNFRAFFFHEYINCLCIWIRVEQIHGIAYDRKSL